jgi:hypothetical protein
METILEILVAAIFTNWKKVKRVFSKKKEPETTVSKQ